MATVSSQQLNTLATNLQKVQRDGGQFIDAQGELVGAAVRNSFRGKVVKLLVDHGRAREGNLGGRIAVAMVGSENFDLLRTPTKELTKTSVANVLALLEKLETKGLDADLKSRVSDRIASTFSLKTPVRKLSARSFENLHQTLRNEVIPQRKAFRQGVLDAVYSGQATQGMKKASQTALLFAAEALEKNSADPAGELRSLFKNEKLLVSGGQGKVQGDAFAVLNEFKAASAQKHAGLGAEVRVLEEGLFEMKAQHAPRENLIAHTEAELNRLKEKRDAPDAELRQQFIDLIRQTHAANDIEDGTHVRLDGSEVKSARGGLAFGGVEVAEAPDTRTTAGDDWAGEFRDALNEAAAEGDKEFILNSARDLRKVLQGKTSSAEDKRAARELSQHDAFLGDFGALFEALNRGDLSGLDAKTAALFRSNAQRFSQVAQETFDQMDGIVKNAQSSPEYGDYLEVYDTVEKAEHEVRKAAKGVRNDARVLLGALKGLATQGT